MNQNTLRYVPGTSWLYLRFYGGTQALEEWLTGPFSVLLQPWLVAGSVDSFHYLRYLDPDYHLRIRLKLADPVKSGEILNSISSICRPLLEDDLMWKMEAGTYEPETGRYGINRMDLVEQWFFADSVFWLDWLGGAANEPDNDRWQKCASRVDWMLNRFALTLKEKSEILDRMRKALSAEFHVTRSIKNQLDVKYRTLSAEMEFALKKAVDSTEQAPTLTDLGATFPDHETLIRSNLVPDLVHMTLNRALRTRHRVQELVLYDFLARYYRSAVARRGSDQ
ncbi:MAG TPA: hypothetical protein DC042_17050 [Bacteroidales bacterium]|nr:hypothetical protein [Bacteroidales bacterium]